MLCFSVATLLGYTGVCCSGLKLYLYGKLLEINFSETVLTGDLFIYFLYRLGLLEVTAMYLCKLSQMQKSDSSSSQKESSVFDVCY